MNSELISLLLKAYDDGIVTSIILSKIVKAKEELKISDVEFHKLDDQIRIETYLKKVEERKRKGVVYFGDLTKQYRITDEDKILLQEIRNTKPTPPAPVKQIKQTVVTPLPEPKPVAPIKQAKQTETAPSVEKKQTPPAKQQTQPVAAPTAEPKATPSTKQPKQSLQVASAELVRDAVLIVDDNPNQIKLLQKLLEKNGYVCNAADSPENALKIAIKYKPSLILCDFNFGIGKHTGLDLFHELKDKKIIVPFIILSAYFQKEFVEYAFGIGVTDYVTKPIDPKTLISTIKQHMQVKK